VKYIYCTDNILNCDDADTLNSTKQSLEFDLLETVEVTSSPRKESYPKTQSTKHSPAKMDAESRYA
jgi:hypothetical protein